MWSSTGTPSAGTAPAPAPRSPTRRSVRSATICGVVPPTHNRAHEYAYLPLADPHRFDCDDLEPEAIPIECAARKNRRLVCGGVEPLDANPRLREIPDRGVEPSRVQRSAVELKVVVGAPRERRLRVDLSRQRHVQPHRQILALRCTDDAER